MYVFFELQNFKLVTINTINDIGNKFLNSPIDMYLSLLDVQVGFIDVNYYFKSIVETLILFEFLLRITQDHLLSLQIFSSEIKGIRDR